MTPRSAIAHDTTNTSDVDQVLIAGGGIGGLSLALALAQHRIPSHVFERREKFSIEGAGIQVGPNGAGILKALGLEAPVCAFAGTPSYVIPRDGVTGDVLARMPVGNQANDTHSAPYWTMHRANLHGALVAAAHDCPLIRLSMGREVLRAEQTSDQVHVVLSNHETDAGQILVGADGIHSRLRKAWVSDTPLRAVNKSAARTVIPSAELSDAVDKSNVGLWLAPGAHVVHYPVRAGKELAVVAIFDDDEVSPDWTTPISGDWVTEHSTGLNADLQTLLHRGTNWQKWSLAALPPLKRWSTGRTTLLGDAAHPVLPFLAQGGVMAMEDAIVLATQLAKADGNAVKALQQYEHIRRPRTAHVARASERNGRLYHYSGFSAAARNRALKALNGSTLINRYRWLYNWKLPS